MDLERDIRSILEQYGLKPAEKLGQHFLIDDRMVEYLGERVQRGANVVEVGAGTGHVTRELAKRAGTVITVEIDRRYEPILDQVIEDCRNVTVLYGDVLTIGMQRLVQDGGINQVIANIPYHITEAFLWKLIGLPVENIILLVGDNIAQLIQASVESSGFGRMSLLAQTFFGIEELANVGKRSFYPVPRTDSVLVELVPKDRLELTGNPTNAVFTRLFATATKSPMVENVIKEAITEVAQRGMGRTLDKREGWQRERSELRRETRKWVQDYNATGIISFDNDADVSQGAMTEMRLLSLIARMEIDDSMLRRPFLKLNNQDIRELVTGVKRILG